MAMEERVLFPAAIKVLLPQDWAEISVTSTARKDPCSDTAVEDKYRLLRQLILQWEQEAESERIERSYDPSSGGRYARA
jgi:hypothetical protein